MTALSNVNTTDIAAAIGLGCRTMQSVFNADDDDIPFFGSELWSEARAVLQRCIPSRMCPGGT